MDVYAGIDAQSSPVEVRRVAAPLTDADFVQLQAQVEGGIAQAKAKKHGEFREHHLQEILRRDPQVLGLEPPVLREVPAWRPAGGPGELGRGFIDLLGKDGLGDVVLVETKLAADDLLVLQGLDYWIWASRSQNKEWLFSRLHADGKRARLRLLYAVGAPDGSTPQLSKYAKVHLDALADEVDWRIALITDWAGGEPVVELLQPRKMPD